MRYQRYGFTPDKQTINKLCSAISKTPIAESDDEDFIKEVHMFINSSHLRKLMTTAYKGGGVRIGYIDEGYVIFGVNGVFGLM